MWLCAARGDAPKMALNRAALAPSPIGRRWREAPDEGTGACVQGGGSAPCRASQTATRMNRTFSSHFPYSVPRFCFSTERRGAPERKADMDTEKAPKQARPRLNPYTKALRRERIFARIKLGWTYERIARDEGVSDRRIRQIVTDALRREELDGPTDHALIQRMRSTGRTNSPPRRLTPATSGRSTHCSRCSTESTAIVRPECGKPSMTPRRASGCSINSMAALPALPPTRLARRLSQRTRRAKEPALKETRACPDACLTKKLRFAQERIENTWKHSVRVPSVGLWNPSWRL
jgi:hypothetical protein